MLKTNFFKLPKTKEFNFVYRYYDERKEKSDSLLKKHVDNGNNSDEQENIRRTERLRDNLSQKWRSNRNSNALAAQANFRLVLILVTLCIGFYFAWQKFELLLYQWLSK